MPVRPVVLLSTVVLALQFYVLPVLPAGASKSRSARADRDHDGLSNRFERQRSNTNPRRRDTDRDWLSDGFEVRRSHTNPRRRDTDRDGVSDGQEVRRGTDPARPSGGGRTRDTHPPDTTISSSPLGTSTSASFGFSGGDDVTRSSKLKFECRLDGGAWAACLSPKTYSGLQDGVHVFEVRAKDAAGNVDPSPASRSWIIDALDASFTYSPGAPFTGQQVTFDAGPSRCTASPCQYRWVDEGSDGPGGSDSLLGSGETLDHTFDEPGTKHARLTVTDARGASASTEQDVVVTQPFDTIAPDTVITASPAANTSGSSATFEFASTETGTSFECRLDSGAWTPCSSPRVYSSLAAGSHSFDVRATDAAGNVDTTPAGRTWTIAAAVAAAFTYSPGSPQTGQVVTFDAGGSTCGAAPCQYEWTDVSDDGPGGTDWPLGSGQTLEFTFQFVGVKHVQLTVTDAAGATDRVQHDVSVAAAPVPDTTAPDTSITANPPGSTSSTGASFSFTGSDAVGVTGYDCQLDSASWAACSSPKAYSGLAVGSHTFRVRARDAAGNVDASPASYSWNVTTAADTTPPDTSISSGPSGTVASGDASFGFSSSEAGSSFECRLDGGDWSGCTSPKSYSGLADGSHSFDVRATDAAGNVDASPASRTWTVSTARSGGGCTQTLSVGANVAGAVAGAANGSTICLNNGDYGTVNLWDIARSGFVTLRSASGRGAVLKPSVGNADFIRLDSLTLREGLVNSCSTNVQFTNSTFQQDRSGLYVDGSACPSTTHNVLVDNVTFANVDLAGFEGRLNFRDVNGVTVKNSFFGNGGYGDGIQTQGNTRNLTIGPNNTFDGIIAVVL